MHTQERDKLYSNDREVEEVTLKQGSSGSESRRKGAQECGICQARLPQIVCMRVLVYVERQMLGEALEGKALGPNGYSESRRLKPESSGGHRMEEGIFWTLELWASVQLEREVLLLFDLENKLSQRLEKGLSIKLAVGSGKAL